MMPGFFEVMLQGKRAFVRLDSINYIIRNDGNEPELVIWTSSGTLFVRDKAEIARIWCLFQVGPNP